jgi:hypothetical protein
MNPGTHEIRPSPPSARRQDQFLAWLSEYIVRAGSRVERDGSGRIALSEANKRTILGNATRILGADFSSIPLSAGQIRDTYMEQVRDRTMADVVRIWQTPVRSANDFYQRIAMPTIVTMSGFLTRYPAGMSDFGLQIMIDSLQGFRRIIGMQSNAYYTAARIAMPHLYGRSERNRVAYASYRETDAQIRTDLNAISARLLRAINRLQSATQASGQRRQILIDDAMSAAMDSLEINNRLGPSFTRMETFFQERSDREAFRTLGLRTVAIAAGALFPMLAGIHMTLLRGAGITMGGKTVDTMIADRRIPNARELAGAALLGAGAATTHPLGELIQRGGGRLARHTGELVKPSGELGKTYYEIGHAAHTEPGEITLGHSDIIVPRRFLRESRAMIYDRFSRAVPSRQ